MAPVGIGAATPGTTATVGAALTAGTLGTSRRIGGIVRGFRRTVLDLVQAQAQALARIRLVLARIRLVLARIRLVLARIRLVLARIRLVLARIRLVLARIRLVPVRIRPGLARTARMADRRSSRRIRDQQGQLDAAGGGS